MVKLKKVWIHFVLHNNKHFEGSCELLRYIFLERSETVFKLIENLVTQYYTSVNSLQVYTTSRNLRNESFEITMVLCFKVNNLDF